MSFDLPRFVVLQRVAWICVVLVFMVLVSSAFIRLSNQGLDCTPWPQCYGQPQEVVRAGVDVMRIVHRLSVFVLTPLLVLLIVRGFARKPEPWPSRWLAVGMVVIAFFLAVLGRWSAGSRLPAIALGNLLGGFVLFAVSVRMATAHAAWRDARPISAAVLRWRSWTVLVIVLQTALGGWLGSSLSALSCPSLPLCSLSEPISWQALNPWHLPQPEAPGLVSHSAGALLHWLHRGIALVIAASVLLTAFGLARVGRRSSAVVLLGLMLVQAALGPLMVAAEFPLLLVLMHNTLTALLLAFLVALR